jgi:hypothetical protein
MANQKQVEERSKENTITTLSDKEIQEMINKQKLRPKIIPIIGMCFGLTVYFAVLPTLYFLITGTLLVRTILILLLVYQYFLADKSENYRKFLLFMRPWEIFKSYTVHYEEELNNERSLFSFHPHGVLGFGPSMSGALNEVLLNSTFCGSRAMRNLPISGIVARWMGVFGVDNKNFKDLMRKNKNIIFVPGGFEEATITQYGKDRVYIKERKGFIKYALEFGYNVYPCYTFNENKIFYTFNYFENFRLLLNKMKFPGTVFFSKFGVFPHTDIDLFTVIGKPINFPVIRHPTKEDVEKYHKIYIDQLVGVYDRYKHYFNASETLEIL